MTLKFTRGWGLVAYNLFVKQEPWKTLGGSYNVACLLRKMFPVKRTRQLIFGHLSPRSKSCRALLPNLISFFVKSDFLFEFAFNIFLLFLLDGNIYKM